MVKKSPGVNYLSRSAMRLASMNKLKYRRNPSVTSSDMESVNSECRVMISRGSQIMMKKMASRGEIRRDTSSKGLYENALAMAQTKSTREKEKT